MKLPKNLTVERLYPTRRAREIADYAFDRLPLSTTIGECMRVWEWTYLDAGGLVMKGVTS